MGELIMKPNAVTDGASKSPWYSEVAASEEEGDGMQAMTDRLYYKLATLIYDETHDAAVVINVAIFILRDAFLTVARRLPNQREPLIRGIRKTVAGILRRGRDAVKWNVIRIDVPWECEDDNGTNKKFADAISAATALLRNEEDQFGAIEILKCFLVELACLDSDKMDRKAEPERVIWQREHILGSMTRHFDRVLASNEAFEGASVAAQDPDAETIQGLKEENARVWKLWEDVLAENERLKASAALIATKVDAPKLGAVDQHLVRPSN